MHFLSTLLVGTAALMAWVVSAVPAGYCHGCNEAVPFGTTYPYKLIYWHDWSVEGGVTNCGQVTGPDYAHGNWIAVSSQYGTNACGHTVRVTYNGITKEGIIIDAGAQQGGLNLNPEFFASFGVDPVVGFFYADYTFI